VSDDVDSTPMGEGQFKGITRPVATYEVIAQPRER
jgi:hypothetical protein